MLLLKLLFWSALVTYGMAQQSTGTCPAYKACLNTCMDNCDSLPESADAWRGVQGPPGKRGHPGQAGPRGEQGEKGSSGECTCLPSDIEEDIRELKRAVKHLQISACAGEEVTFDRPKRIHGIITQGQSGVDTIVTSYTVKYRTDDGNWRDIVDEHGSTKTFYDDNNDANAWKKNYLPDFVSTRAVRVVVQTWKSRYTPCMRIGLIGC